MLGFAVRKLAPEALRRHSDVHVTFAVAPRHLKACRHVETVMMRMQVAHAFLQRFSVVEMCPSHGGS